MLSQAMTSTIVNQGHLSEVWKEITSKDALQQLAITMGTAGLGREFGLTMPGKNSDFLSHVKYHAQKALINTSVRAAIQGGKVQDLLKKAGMQALVDAFASYGAQRIGDAYAMGTKEMDYLTHKVLHGVLGGAAGALLGADPKKGAISGALSSMLAEVLAEAVIRPEEIGLEILDKAQKEGRFPGEQEYLAEVDRALRPLMDRIKLVTGVVALASGQDVEIALRTSGNALDENSKKMLRDTVINAIGKAIEKIGSQLRKGYATFKDKIRKGGTKDPGTVPGGSGANPNAVKPGTGQAGAPLKQGNPPAKAGVQEDFRPKHQLKQHQEKITDVPENRVAYEKYLAERRANLTREEAHSVHDPNLRKLMKDIYQETDKIGSGGTGNAVRHTKNTGEKIGDSTHLEKAQEYSKALEKWLKNNPSRLNTDTEKMQKIDITLGSSHDRQIAEQALNELRNSVGKDPMKF